MFTERFNRKPFFIGHGLSDHPLFALPRLIELAQELPSDRIENCQSWMVLKNVERSGPYANLMTQCLSQIREITDSFVPGFGHEQGFIFISSPRSVTPFHIDPENDFLLQIRGDKKVQMFDREDRVVMSEDQVEGFFNGAHRNIPYNDAHANRGQWYDLSPDQGLHFPVAAPHWVKNGDAVSISFSITFQTEDSRRLQSLHRLNAKLRKRGITPSPVGRSWPRDKAKLAIIDAAKWLRG